jgi:uncharacterized membrane protein
MSTWVRLLHNYGYIVLNLLTYPAFLGGVYLLISGKTWGNICLVLCLVAIINAIIMSELKEFFAVKIKLPLYPTGNERGIVNEVYKSNKLNMTLKKRRKKR